MYSKKKMGKREAKSVPKVTTKYVNVPCFKPLKH